MKALVATLILMLMSTAAFAQAISTDGLTEQQRAELALQAAKMKVAPQDAASVSASVRQEAEAWGTMGANVVHGVVGAAKELGVAANEFATTPLGKVTIAVIVYKVLGEDVLGAAVGLFIITVTFSLALYIIIKYRWGAKYEYEYKPKFWGLYQKRYITSVHENEEGAVVRIIVGIILILLGLIVGLNTIF